MRSHTKVVKISIQSDSVNELFVIEIVDILHFSEAQTIPEYFTTYSDAI